MQGVTRFTCAIATEMMGPDKLDIDARSLLSLPSHRRAGGMMEGRAGQGRGDDASAHGRFALFNAVHTMSTQGDG